MKILYTTTIGGTMNFFTSFIRGLTDGGHTVDIATNEMDGASPVPEEQRALGCRIIQVPWQRSPLDKRNLRAVKELGKLVSGRAYDIVHCHTPVAAACTRIACRKARKQGTKVIYTAHGFHFYKGAPVKNWLVFYPAEKLLSRFTDVLITINKEDYDLASKKFHAGKTEYVPGVGIDLSRFRPDREAGDRIRGELDIRPERKVVLSVGELNDNKNHASVIRALEGLDATYVIAGGGTLNDSLTRLAEEKGVDLKLLGHRDDIADIYNAADVYVLPSKREGLNVSIMEAMACGLPVACSKIRGNNDLIDEGKGGMLFDPYSVSEIASKISALLADANRSRLGEYNMEKVKEFSCDRVNVEMTRIYAEALDSGQKRQGDIRS